MVQLYHNFKNTQRTQLDILKRKSSEVLLLYMYNGEVKFSKSIFYLFVIQQKLMKSKIKLLNKIVYHFIQHMLGF